MWRNFPPPIRPSIADQQVYEECIKKIRPTQESNVLILGVTPELRKLANKHNCRVVAIDLHAVMIKAMNRLMSNFEGAMCNETVVKGYWLAMPFKKREFRLILSDCSMNSLTRVESHRLLEELNWLLKEDGYIFMRVMIRSKEWTEQSILDVFKKNRPHPESSKKAFEEMYPQILCSIEAHDPISSRSSIAKARKEWRRLYHRNEISKREFEIFEDVLPKGDYSPTLLKRSELEELLNQHFKIVSIENSKSRFVEYYPIYYLKPI